MAFGMKNILQGGLAANYSEQSPECILWMERVSGLVLN